MSSPHELWKQAGGGTPAYSPQRYLQLLREVGHLIPLAPGEKPEPLPCGWPRHLSAARQCVHCGWAIAPADDGWRHTDEVHAEDVGYPFDHPAEPLADRIEHHP